MSERALAPQTAIATTATPGQGGLLQRQCACGTHTAAGGECKECKKQRNLQKQLAIGASNDPFELEADRVADQVMAMPPGSGASCAPPRIQRFTGQAGGEAGSAPASVDRVLAGPGRPLDPVLQRQMGRRFGYDFSQVRVHTGAEAEQSAREVSAHAYTVGHDLVFGAGQYAPDTPRGRHLLAHELTHVVQQGSNRVTRSVQRVCGPTDISTAVAGRASCNDSFGGRFLSGLPLFKFNKGCDDFAAGEDTALQTFVTGQPAAATFELHGFASSDGARAFNEDLGCARAMKAFSLMTTADPAHGFAGIAASRITAVVNHGPVRGGSASSLRSVVIRALGGTPGPTPTPPPAGLQTVTIPTNIRGTATPAAMTQNRIPPRVDTPVTVTFGGAPTVSAPVSLAVEGGGGGNGSATVDGAASAAFAVTGATVVNLRGVDQTTDAAHAAKLRLVARQRGTQIAASGGFSVSSIPQNMSHPFDRLITDADCPTFGFAAGCGFRGMVVDQNMDSDSGTPADLDRVQQSERIQAVTTTGIFAGTTPSTGCYVSCTPSPPDFHGSPGLAGVSSPGVFRSSQTFMFRDNRTGASEIPMTNSGFIINFDVGPVPGSGVWGLFQDFQLTVSSTGTRISATDPNPVCPSGTITSAAGRTSVTRTIPL